MARLGRHGDHLGHYGLKATELTEITARQTRRARRAPTRQGVSWARSDLPDAGLEEADRGPYGQGQGPVEFWGRQGRKPGRDHVRDRGRERETAKEASSLRAMKLPIAPVRRSRRLVSVEPELQARGETGPFVWARAGFLARRCREATACTASRRLGCATCGSSTGSTRRWSDRAGGDGTGRRMRGRPDPAGFVRRLVNGFDERLNPVAGAEVEGFGGPAGNGIEKPAISIAFRSLKPS